MSACFVLADMVALPPLPEPGVVLAHPGLQKEVLVEDGLLGKVSHIQLFPETNDERFIGIAGDRGVLFLGRDASKSGFLALGEAGGEVRFAGVRSDGYSGLIGVQTWHTGTIFDAEGKVMWRVPRHMGQNSVAAADFTGDGRLEYLVGYNGSGGVRLFDDQGEQLWRQSDGNVWRVACLDTGEGAPVIVHSNAGGEMVFRDGSGAVLRKKKPQGYFSSFSVCTWTDGEPHLLDADDDLVRVHDMEGNTVALYEAPLAGDLGDAHGTAVRLDADAPPYFAVALALRERTVLYLYDHDKKLVYHEVLPEASTGIAAVPAAQDGAEELYVGGSGKVLRYTRAAGQEPPQPPQETQ